MFPQLSAPAPTSLSGRALRTARLVKAFATLDDRPMDQLGRPVEYDQTLEPWEQIYAGQRPVAMAPMHRRRNAAPRLPEGCALTATAELPSARTRGQHH